LKNSHLKKRDRGETVQFWTGKRTIKMTCLRLFKSNQSKGIKPRKLMWGGSRSFQSYVMRRGNKGLGETQQSSQNQLIEKNHGRRNLNTNQINKRGRSEYEGRSKSDIRKGKGDARKD